MSAGWVRGIGTPAGLSWWGGVPGQRPPAPPGAGGWEFCFIHRCHFEVRQGYFFLCLGLEKRPGVEG